MHWLSRVLVLVAVLAAGGYTLHQVRTCRIAFVPAALQAPGAVASPAPGAELQAGSSQSLLIYPSPRVEAQLKLGYRTFERQGDGTFVVVPMPPQSALTTTLQLETARRSKLRATLADPRCDAPVEVAAYRPDRGRPLFSSELSSRQHRLAADIDMSGDSYPGVMLVTVRMADGAANNWWCNVNLAWDPAG